MPPPLTLLEEDKGKPNTGDIKANANIIKRTLANFGIEVEMDEITVGPTVTRYALKPAEGVKLSRIVGLQNDLALSLAAHPIRIEAPIPGKNLVGIEIPNKSKSIVGLATLLSDEKFQNSAKQLTIALGRNISGQGGFRQLGENAALLGGRHDRERKIGHDSLDDHFPFISQWSGRFETYFDRSETSGADFIQQHSASAHAGDHRSQENHFGLEVGGQRNGSPL